MPRAVKPPVKTACIACRTSKTRCDGQYPCSSCFSRSRECSYQPSRRGGARRGARYEEAQRRSTASNLLPPSSISNAGDEFEPFLDSMIGLVSPFAGIHNLDLSTDSLSTADETHQIWGQLTPHADSSFESTPVSGGGTTAIRAYESEEEILNAYYIYIHPYLPLLPPPLAEQHEDQSVTIRPADKSPQPEKSHVPYWPASSLSLALSAMLVLMPPVEDQAPMSETSLALRRSYAQLYAQEALAAVETEIENLSPALNSNMQAMQSSALSDLHPQVPVQLDPVFALVVLGIYEYCQRGNVSRMRARGNQAITTAMDLSLHALDSKTTDFSEAQRRAWWMTVWVAYLSSNFLHAAPIVSWNDPRITTPYPKFNVSLEPWPIMMKAQEALFESNKILHDIERVDETVVPSGFSIQIRKMDSHLVSLVSEADRHTLTTSDQGPEASIAKIMWMVSRMLIHAARTRLHRFRAFMDIPLFLDKYCDLTAINNSQPSSHQVTTPRWVTDNEGSFPFTEQESCSICLKSSLVIATVYRNLPYPNVSRSESCVPDFLVTGRSAACSGSIRCFKSIPYFACSAMQSCYTLLMILHQLRASLATDQLADCYHLLNDPSPASEIADAERLREELRHGVETLLRSLKSDVIFEGVGGMGREIEGAYLAAFPGAVAV